MKQYRIETSKVEKVFKGVYEEQRKPTSDQPLFPTQEDQWANEVMRQIRATEPVSPLFDISTVFEQIFWRFAPVAMLVVCLLTVWLFQIDATVEYDMASLFMTDPIGFGHMTPLDL